MAKLRLSYDEKLLCGLAIDPGVSVKEKPVDDEVSSASARASGGFIPGEELGIEHVLPGTLTESQLEACMDPLEYAVRPRDLKYGQKTLARNLRLC